MKITIGPSSLVRKIFRSFQIKNRLDMIILWRYKRHILFALKMLKMSKSQISQDVFVACELQLWKKRSAEYFVEFGAADGLNHSNTYILEKFFNWNGILAEPARIWHDRLIANRDCHIDKRCLYSETGKRLQFTETPYGEYSTITKFENVDSHARKRSGGINYEVETISLNDLLTESLSPRNISYLSIDTEGSEYEILRELDFKTWSFKIITVEHNFTESRNSIFQLLSNEGYRRILENHTKMDDWYVKI
jgi:FkbM family methyltransferase